MATQKTQRVKVTRAFYHKGEVLGAGSVLDLPVPIAFELRSAHKVEFVQADTKLQTNSNQPEPADATPPADKEKAGDKAKGDKK
jgi:hypothetical protein